MRNLLSNPHLYSLWQRPFVAQKVEPFLSFNEVTAIRRVLDVGCGPGTNMRLFSHCDYLGVDLDAHYVAQAEANHGPHFRHGDAGSLDVGDFAPVDCLFVNSLTHHLDDQTLDRLLARTDLVSPSGKLHLIDLYLPPQGIARRLALADRGEYPRPLEVLRESMERYWSVEVERTYRLRLCGVELWSMVYFRSIPRRPT